MLCRPHDTPSSMTAAVPRRVGFYVAVVQFFFALTWSVYVIYLPQLAAQAGIPKTAVIWLLMLDQLVFLVADYACGVASDRMARLNSRIGPAVLAVTVLSCAAFLLLPFIAPQGSALLFIAVTVLWTVGSSALRAPPLNIIGRHAARPSQPALVALSMLGLGLAAAAAPYLATALREVDPRWPFALASVSLAATTLGIVAAERALQGRPAATATSAPDSLVKSDPRRLPWAPCLVAAVLAAIAFQVHVFLNSTPLYLRHANSGDIPQLAPVFWIGFNLGLWPASLAIKRHGGIAVTAAAGLTAAVASAWAAGAGSIETLVAAQALAGAAWAAVLTSAFSAALALGHTGAEGRFSGALSSTLALAALLRMGLLASGLTSLPHDSTMRLALDWLPAALWLLAGALLLAIWQREAARTRFRP